MKISEHTFDRLDETFAHKPISQLIDNGMKPNWGTESHNLEKNCDILKDWSLFVNESKTVFTRVYLAGMSELDTNSTKRSESHLQEPLA